MIALAATLLYVAGWFITATAAGRLKYHTVSICVDGCKYRPASDYSCGVAHHANCKKRIIAAKLPTACLIALAWPVTALVYGVFVASSVGKKAPLYTDDEIAELEKQLDVAQDEPKQPVASKSGRLIARWEPEHNNPTGIVYADNGTYHWWCPLECPVGYSGPHSEVTQVIPEHQRAHTVLVR